MQILVLLGMYFDTVHSCGGIGHQPDTFIQIGSGHTVIKLSNFEKKNLTYFKLEFDSCPTTT